MSAESYAGSRVTVMGLGRFGGGLGVTRWLCEQGAEVLLTDQASLEDLAEPLAKLEDLITQGQVQLRLGEHNVSDFTCADAVVVNPAVKPDSRFVRAAQAAGVRLVTEIGLLIERLPNRQNVVGITGSAGKSTTAAMTAHLLKAIEVSRPSGRQTWLGGNIGGSLLSQLGEITSEDWVVLELSSFMLHYLEPLAWSPGVAVITNIQPNHLDWHASFDAYREAKESIATHRRPGDVFVRGETVTPLGCDLSVPGVHNQRNAAIAVAAVRGVTRLDLPETEACEFLGDFTGLPHRLQLVHEREGVRFFNDSKSTTPEAAILAIDALSGDTAALHVILGGYDKSSDLTAMAKHATEFCRAIYTIGQTGAELSRVASRERSGVEVHSCETLDQAVRLAKGRMRSPAVLLLSPGCASWDQFTNYEHRGARFIELARE